MVLGAMENPSSTSPIPTKNPTTANGTATSPKKKNPPPSLYQECLKNHAASIGGHALDGCGEFMPSPTAVPSDPTSLKCAACGCHRNFHRRRQEEPQNNKHFVLRHSPPFPPPPPPHRNPSPSPSLSPSPPSPTPSPQSPPPVSHLPPNSFFSSPPPPPAQMLLALSTGERFSGESSRKRFRTKFNSEQKEKMTAFADRVGWRMQRSEENLVEQFCAEIGVRKGVLKVWMHNNKHTLGKKPVLSAGVSGGSTANNNHDVGGDDEKDEETKSSLNVFANGSSSTS